MKIDWREVHGQYIKDPRLGHRLGRNYPGGELTDPIWKLYWLGTDEHGLVFNDSPSRDFSLGDKRYKRVFLFGGSTAMGLGVEKNSQTICAQLEKYLKRTEPQARTVNCAVGSYASWQEMLYLCLEMIIFQPDFVVIFNGWNDFLHSSWGNKGYQGKWIPNTHRSLDDVVALMQTGTGDISLATLLKRKILKSKLLRELLSKRRYAIQAGIWSDPDWRVWSLKPEAAAWYAANIRSMIGISRMNGARAIALLQPQLMWGKRSATAHEDEMLTKIEPRLPPMRKLAPQWYEHCSQHFARMRTELHDGKNVWVEDAANWLDDYPETIYHDYNHYNERGQEILAEKLGQVIQRMLGDEP